MRTLRQVICFFLLFIFSPLSISAQDSGNSEQTQKVPKNRAQRKLAKQKWKEERAKKRDDKKMVKEHHKRLQTKKVNKRMKKNKKKSERVNENKREFFLKRWFRKKHR